ncbi:Crp/Fnr family transcriptional regulator [Rhodoferax saidenbachensis]|uniref:Crp/Fnr family transcriptional regulator n=1 Tax=Rhodoferax saidenbachensis TaxID=1484693 RepID=A0A1P8K554_9BURK|nr:Crp/Fnr family transcriptional regulator [Rhodoferax saidenbachensis]APW41129.1 Crp/Fnr family transcriptional regulator [Rhodoferax saidenbachensis]
MANSTNEILRSLSQNPWFDALPLAERKAMLAAADTLHLRPGEMLYRKGDTAGGFFGVLNGALKVSTLGEDGREGILSVMEAGNWFGETTLLDGLPRPHDVTAVQACTLLAIHPAAFERLMQRSAFSRAMAALLCSRVRALYGIVEDAMLRSTRTRVARRLLSLARGDSTMAPQARASVAVSQEALAMMLGMTRQTLSKELKGLVRAGVLSLGYGRIDILSLAELERCGAVG